MGAGRLLGERGEQRPEHHAEADHADVKHERANDRNAGRVKRQIDEPRAEPDPAAERSPLAGAACDHDPEQGDDRDREGFLEIGLRAHRSAGDRVRRGQRSRRARRHSSPAILRGLEASRGEDVDEQQQRAEREDFQFYRHRVPPPHLRALQQPGPIRT